ncbi:MAG: hypothetical protein KAU21_14230 [Gammaproteobacteria bacterium]|nr:hypothetical protein [Gammaproteobacteria bacterium]
MFTRENLYKTIILVAVVVLLFAPVRADNFWWREAINSGHTVLFVFLSLVIYSQLKARTPDSNILIIYLYVLVIGLLLGVVIEVLQTLVQREASLNDLYRNFLGIMTGLCLLAVFTLKNIRHQKIIAVLLILTSAGFLLLGLTPLMRLSWHYLERASAFPVIMDFDSNWSSSFMHYDTGKYPGISVIEPEPDWSDYRTLYFSVYSVNQDDINLILRVHDKMHSHELSDRFNMKLLIQPGFNEFQIPLNAIQYGPLGRDLDLKCIMGIILFSSKQEEWVQVEVSNISLE